jgi:predicted transcriptional regulator with HTH domain
MPRISQKNKEKISEQILSYLYNSFPRPIYTVEIARELARDEEFIKLLLLDLEKKQLVVMIDKNPQGIKYLKRLRWRISNKVHSAYQSQL